MALSTELLHDAVHLRIDIIITVSIHQTDLRTEDAVQDQVSAGELPPLFQHQNAFHTQLSGTGGSEHSVVRLGTTSGENNIRPLAPGICQKKLQFADLVATQGHARHIVPLDVNILSDLPAQVFQLIQGSGQLSEGNAGEINNLFHKSASFGCSDHYNAPTNCRVGFFRTVPSLCLLVHKFVHRVTS